MRKLPRRWNGWGNEHASISVAWLGIAAAILIALMATAVPSRIVSANNPDRADLDLVLCISDGIELTWRTENEGQAAAPDGWKVERTHLDSQGKRVVRGWIFTDDAADALLTPSQEYWEWVNSEVSLNVLYTYRVRAINADESDMDGRNWSRIALVECSADPSNQPGISMPHCEDAGVSMFWHTASGAEAPEGWKVERSHQDSEGNWIVETIKFIGQEADALQSVRENHWDWVDTGTDWYVDYHYRVRAIDTDGTDTAGRNWSRYASTICTGGELGRPGISIPRLDEGKGVSMFWHTSNRGRADAPEGWKVERRHWDYDSGEWVVRTFTFIGAEADALQTYSEDYWDWVDTSAGVKEEYTYRVRAINADGSDMDGRVWSRRAPVECGCPGA